MSETVRETNNFFRNATRNDVDSALSKIIMSERQSDIFDRYYIKRQNVNFIADTLCVSAAVVNKELKKIRKKLMPFI